MAQLLDLEVLNDALSFEIEKYRGKKFREYDMFDGLMDRHLILMN